MTRTIDAHDNRAICSCVVVSHPAGDVWTTRSEIPCVTHRHGQPWRITQPIEETP